MSQTPTARERSDEFLKISGQFKLGALVTESSHPVTANLSDVARQDIAKALDLLFQVDGDVVAKYREFAESGRAGEIAATVLRALKNGGKIFFTGCGSTGRLSIQLVSIWRDFWNRQKNSEFEHCAFSVMAGGDFALIKSVEGFEDFAVFGKKQIGDLGVSNKDVVFAITEGGETSFVIGTAWRGVEAGAKVYFVYNNPDEILCAHVERSREIIEDTRIEKINLTTGPMAITGSTRMQATTIQLCVMLTILEIVVRELILECGDTSQLSDATCRGEQSADISAQRASRVTAEFSAKLTELHAALRSPEVLSNLAKTVALEETIYRSGHKNNYFADRFGIDVLTDTTERSPTYCTPPFRKFDDATATESWAFLFVPADTAEQAWRKILKRESNCVEWDDATIRELVGEEKFSRTREIVRKISRTELMRFKIGLDGLPHRKVSSGDSAVAIVSEHEMESPFFREQLEAAKNSGAQTGLICFRSRRREEALNSTMESRKQKARIDQSLITSAAAVVVNLPETDFFLDGITRVGVKMLLNALSTCTMIRLGRVMGNTMIWVVASNLKLIDRATRYTQKLTGLNYEDSNRLLFEAIEYVEPRMKSDQAYPPVVGLAVMRARHKLTNEQAEQRLKESHE
jgi:N-acetylmuramic acid 6-phosphate etherase